MSQVVGDTDNQGERLRNLRKLKGLSQARLAEMAGVGRHTVVRWEGKSKFSRQSRALAHIFAVLGAQRRHCAGLSRARVCEVLLERTELMNFKLAKEASRQKALEAQRTANLRVRCRAKTKKGSLCRLLSEPGRRRCKFHGGCSTGPKTAEGKERIAKAQRRRWDRFREERRLMESRP